MTNKERRDRKLLYISGEEIFEEQKKARRLTQELNSADRSDFQKISQIVKEFLGKSEGAFINPLFYSDYGTDIEVGKYFFANYNCTILDVAKVIIEITDRRPRMWQSILPVIGACRYPKYCL